MHVAELRRLSATCEFGTFLNEALRDRFVCGLNDESCQRRLLTDAKLTLIKAVEIAQGMETAWKTTLSSKERKCRSNVFKNKEQWAVVSPLCREGVVSVVGKL